MAIDDRDVYFTSSLAGTGAVLRGARDGCAAPTTIAKDLGRPYGIAVDASSVYWVNQDDGTVMRVPKP